jgi:hypothetical protein
MSPTIGRRIMLASAILLGIALGSTLAATPTCCIGTPLPVPCQLAASICSCPSGCSPNWQGSVSVNCAQVTDGCCQWREQNLLCEGGSACEGCTVQRVPKEFTDYRAFWCCRSNANGQWACHLCPQDGG